MFKNAFYKMVVLPLIWLGLNLLVVSNVSAGLFGKPAAGGPQDVGKVFVLNTEVLKDNQLLLRWDILDDYYLYDNRMKFSSNNGVTIKEVSRSKTKSKDDALFGKVDVYYHSSEVVLQFSNLNAAGEVDLKIQYQGCWDGGVCYPPVTEQRLILMPVGEGIAQGVASVPTQPSSVDLSADINVSASSNKSTATTQATPLQNTVSEQDYFSNLLATGSLSWVLAAFFIAGLALSLTPCVFPMIPILSSIIAGQGKDITKVKALILTVIYVLSVAVTYTLAGVLAGLFGENLQVLFQTTWIIVLFSGVFVLLALSMFGFYELQLPNAVQSKLSTLSNNQQGGNYIGVAIMGVLSALIVGPCMAAPLAGALIYIGQTADPILGGLALFSLSIGMGVPLLLVGLSAGHLMPKVGAWMNTVKAGFGILLIFMAIYLLDRVVSIQVTMLLSAMTFICTAVYMGALNTITEQTKNVTKFIKAIGLIFLIYGLSLMIGVFVGNGNLLKPLKGLSGGAGQAQENVNNFSTVTSIAQLEPLLQQAKNQQRPVLLDFYADWCISCVEVEFMFEEPKVAKVLKNMSLIKVDLTDFNDEARELLEKYQVLGPPALVFYNREGNLETAMKVVGLVSADKFLKHIQPLVSK
ncbi:MAG: protein-disulfide reductase DsbD [Oceanospirillaceae bacterium]